MSEPVPADPDRERLRRWLTNLHRPDRLDDPALGDLLRAHGRPWAEPGARAGQSAAALLRDAIESLRPSQDAPPAASLPYRVLVTCFVDGTKGRLAAAALGLSERQLTRERSRALALLAGELAVPATRIAEASPTIPRPELVAALAAALEWGRRVHVTGSPGAGKTTVVAAYAAGAGRVLWHDFVPRLGAGLHSLLYELGTQLLPDDPTLASYLEAALPRPDLELAARIALAGLRSAPVVVVLDDFEPARADAELTAFVEELARGGGPVRVVTIGPGGPDRGVPSLAVPPLDGREIRAVLALHGAPDDDLHAQRVRASTGGNAELVALAARWLSGRFPAAGDALRGAASEGRRVVPLLAALTRRTRVA